MTHSEKKYPRARGNMKANGNPVSDGFCLFIAQTMAQENFWHGVEGVGVGQGPSHLMMSALF
jgi:hypothetical protein